MRISDFKALTFDCYGTLIDWEAGILSVLRPWAKTAGLTTSDDRLLEVFAEAEPRCEAETPTAPYRDVLRDTMAEIGRLLAAPVSEADAAALASSVGDWPAFPDTVAALHQLQKWHKLVVVSNVDNSSFARTQERLGIEFDAVVTAEEVGAYKPDPKMFLHAFEVIARWGIARQEILHVAQSLFHDHVPAKALEMTTVWVDRRRGRVGSGATKVVAGPVVPDWTVPSLQALVELETLHRGDQ